MTSFAAYRPFSIDALVPEGWGALGGALDLIAACQVKHQGYPDCRPGSEGSRALAEWIMAHQDIVDKPKLGTHPLMSGTTIERILIGEVLPSEDLGVAIANMTEGVVLPYMFGRPEADTPSSAPQAPGADEKVPEPLSATPMAATPAPSDDDAAELPRLGALGGPLPSGRLFHPIADGRFAEGFVLTGCGLALCLDESTAKAMQTALAEGIAHIQHVRRAGMAVAA